MNHLNMSLFPRVKTVFAFVISGALSVPLLGAAPVQAQDSQPSEQEKAMHYSLYYENFKNDNFESAKSDLQWILDNAPGFPKGDDRNYKRKVELYEGLAENASAEEDRQAYLDTAATALATAPSKMEENGIDFSPFEWEIMKGQFLEDHKDALPDLSASSLEEPIAHYKRAFNLAPKEVNSYYIQRILRLYLDNNEQQKALAFVNEVEKKRGDDEEVAQIISSVRDDIFGRNPQARITYLEEQLEANPDSTAILRELFNTYTRQGNVQAASKLESRIMESDPTPELIREVAKMRLEDGRPKKALAAFDRLTKAGGSLTAEDHFERANAYVELDRLRRARNEYRKALEKTPDYGRAYIAIGDLYTQAVSDCSGDELGRDDKAVYWAAVDKYRQAKQVDSSVASTANSKIQTYRSYFPTQEDIFYREQWTKGESVTINTGCYSWIQETTTVRQAP